MEEIEFRLADINELESVKPSAASDETHSTYSVEETEKKIHSRKEMQTVNAIGERKRGDNRRAPLRSM